MKLMKLVRRMGANRQWTFNVILLFGAFIVVVLFFSLFSSSSTPSSTSTTKTTTPSSSSLLSAQDRKYKIVVDAGSSGSRVQIYSYNDPEIVRREWVKRVITNGQDPKRLLSLLRDSTSDTIWNEQDAKWIQELHAIGHVDKGLLPDDKGDWQKKVEPGISSFGSHVSDLPAYLENLLSFAESRIPASHHSTTPIYIYATAGMRLLPTESQKAILEQICSVLEAKKTFSMPGGCLKHHVRIITGEEEGLFGWASVNYLMNRFTPAPIITESTKSSILEPPSTLGFADMGGASTQLCFEPVEEMAKEHANDLIPFAVKTLSGIPMRYGVWVKTWLGFGVNEARRRYLDFLVGKAKDLSVPIQDPCLPKGLKTPDSAHYKPTDGSGKSVEFVGSGEAETCSQYLSPVLNATAPCTELPCLWNGVHAPLRTSKDLKSSKDVATGKMLPKLQFVGVAEYWYTNDDIYDFDGIYHFDDFSQAATKFCASSWESIESAYKQGKYPGYTNPQNANFDREKLMMGCFRSLWVSKIVYDGLGVEKISLPSKPGNGNSNGHDHEKDDAFLSMETIKGTAVSWTLGVVVMEVSRTITPLEQFLETIGGSEKGKMEFFPRMQQWMMGGSLLLLGMVVLVLTVLFRCSSPSGAGGISPGGTSGMRFGSLSSSSQGYGRLGSTTGIETSSSVKLTPNMTLYDGRDLETGGMLYMNNINRPNSYYS